MKLSLDLKLGQQLTMTPQLQQAIRLLQLSTLDLQQEIRDALESNPMLEQDEGTEKIEDDASSHDGQPLERESASTPDLDKDESSWESEHIPEQLSVDSNWEDIYTNGSISGAPGSSGNAGSGMEDSDFESRTASADTLQDHLRWQLNLTPMSDSDRIIALAIIDAIETNGQLSSSVESIHAGLSDALQIDLDEVLAVLHRIQHFDPVGVGSRDLRECLLLQLQQLPPETSGLAVARQIIDKYLDILGSHDYSQLMKLLRVKEDVLSEAVTLILSLNPRPGADVAQSEASYIVPDVLVYKERGQWLVELNPEVSPRLRINPVYAALVQRQDNSPDNSYLRDNLQAARWFIKSLQSRNDTLLKVASRIVEHQQDFLEHGEEAMKPLILQTIAEAVEMHESTISRVTTQKYMHTPRGIFELKYFFSSQVGTEAGEGCSSTAIRAIIRKLVAAENSRKPLSDSKIANLLAEQGIQVARRTIAKYRESLSIAPSNERKRLV